MALSALSKYCCDEEGDKCFKDLCDERISVHSTIAAIAIVENDTFPTVGETINLDGSAVVLDESNYADSLIAWVRERQYECTDDGKLYHFLHNGLIAKGTRAKPTQVFAENSSQYRSPRHLRYETTSEIMLEENYLPNGKVVTDIVKRRPQLSIAYFFAQGVLVVNSNFGEIYINEFGFEVTGERNENIMGSISFSEQGEKDPVFYYSQDDKKFTKELRERTQFTFGATVYTGVTELACGSVGGCVALTTPADTAFSVEVSVNELVNCGEFVIFQNCDEAVDPTLDLVLDTTTGAVTSATGLPAGKYDFTIEARNGCCVYGSKCFSITATA